MSPTTTTAAAAAVEAPPVPPGWQQADRLDPTRSHAQRAAYVHEMGERFDVWADAVEAAARSGLLRLTDRPLHREAVTANQPTAPPPPNPYGFPTVPDRERAFTEWLKRAQDAVILGTSQQTGAPWTDSHIRSAYSRGVTHADAALRAQGVTTSPGAVEDTFSLPLHRDTLGLFFRRQYEGLDNITRQTGTEIARELTESFLAGRGTDETARRLRDRVGVAKSRGERLARTEFNWAYNEGALNRYEQALGAGGKVSVVAEVLTAGDDRVCPVCERLELDSPFTISQARNLLPAHPNCRCAWAPRVQGGAAGEGEGGPLDSIERILDDERTTIEQKREALARRGEQTTHPETYQVYSYTPDEFAEVLRRLEYLDEYDYLAFVDTVDDNPYLHPDAAGFYSPGPRFLNVKPRAIEPGKAQRYFEEGWWSSPDPYHAVTHEVGHAAHRGALTQAGHTEMLPESVWTSTTLADPAFVTDVGETVSTYAATSPFEFVAEVFAGAQGGQSYPQWVWDMYDALDGPDLPDEARQVATNTAAVRHRRGATTDGALDAALPPLTDEAADVFLERGPLEALPAELRAEARLQVRFMLKAAIEERALDR